MDDHRSIGSGRGLALLIGVGILLFALGVGAAIPVRATTDTGDVVVAATCGPPMALLAGDPPQVRDVGDVLGTDVGFDLEPGQMERACRAAAQRRILWSIAAGIGLVALVAAIARYMRSAAGQPAPQDV